LSTLSKEGTRNSTPVSVVVQVAVDEKESLEKFYLSPQVEKRQGGCVRRKERKRQGIKILRHRISKKGVTQEP